MSPIIVWVNSKIVALLILCCLGMVIYSNTLHSSFQFDDKICIVRNPYIRNVRDFKNIWNFWPTRFITILSFALNYYFHKLDVFGYHFLNIIIHLSTSVLVWWFTVLSFFTPIMRKNKIASYSYMIAFFVALIFLSHPVQTESVTYIWQRVTSLAGFLCMFSLCLYVRSRLLWVNNGSKGRWLVPYVFSLVVGVISMFTKENAITLPLIVILYEFCFFEEHKHIKWKFISPFLLIFPIVPVVLFFTKPLTFIDILRFVQYPISGVYYLFTQTRVVVTFIRLLFLPLNQNIDYDYSISHNLFELPVLISLIILGLILFMGIRMFKRDRMVSFGIFWFFISLLPEGNIIPLSDVMFEHRLYLPILGYSFFLVGIMYYFLGKNNLKLMILILILIVTSYSFLTYKRNCVWKNEFTLWNDAIHKSPKKARPHTYLGLAYLEKGNLLYGNSKNPPKHIYYEVSSLAKADNLIQAISEFNSAIQIDPRYVLSYNYRGYAYQLKGDFNQAISDFTKAIEIDPGGCLAYEYRAIAHFFKKEYAKSWGDVHILKTRYYSIDPEFLEALKKASGREQ